MGRLTGRWAACKAAHPLEHWLPTQGLALRRQGSRWWGRCPFHADGGRPNFCVNPRTQTWRCWVCGVGGDLYDFCRLRYGWSLRETVAHLGDPLPAARVPAPASARSALAPRAPLARRHAVYAALCARAGLDPADRLRLVARGLSDAAIAAAGYATLPPPPRRARLLRLLRDGSLDGVPGFVRSRPDAPWRLPGPGGLLIPVRDPWGRIQALQVRTDGTPKYRWVSSPGDGGASSGAPIHWAGREWLPRRGDHAAAGWLWITEGPLKADVAAAWLQEPVLGVPGAGLWRHAVRWAARWPGPGVIVAFDQDADPATAAAVAAHARALAAALRAAGVWRVRLARWTGAKGLDDALLHGCALWLEEAPGEELSGRKGGHFPWQTLGLSREG